MTVPNCRYPLPTDKKQEYVCVNQKEYQAFKDNNMAFFGAVFTITLTLALGLVGIYLICVWLVNKFS